MDKLTPRTSSETWEENSTCFPESLSSCWHEAGGAFGSTKEHIGWRCRSCCSVKTPVLVLLGMPRERLPLCLGLAVPGAIRHGRRQAGIRLASDRPCRRPCRARCLWSYASDLVGVFFFLMKRCLFLIPAAVLVHTGTRTGSLSSLIFCGRRRAYLWQQRELAWGVSGRPV